MEEIRKIVQEELNQMMTSEVKKKDVDFVARHPIFSDPHKALDYATEWQNKAAEMNRFYWQVEEIIRSPISSKDKVILIGKLLPHYGWV